MRRHSTRKQDIWRLSNFEHEALQLIADCSAQMYIIRRRINDAVDELHQLELNVCGRVGLRVCRFALRFHLPVL